MNTNIKQNIKAIILGLTLTLGMSYTLAAWTNPTAAPTAGNVDAPINVGGGVAGNIYSQAKSGLLTLDHLITGDLTVASLNTVVPGQVLTATDSTGKVAWSSTIPHNTYLFANLDGYSANNSSASKIIGVLEPGTYTFSGRMTSSNSGGGGWAGVVLGASDTMNTTSLDTQLTGFYGSVATGGSDPSYKVYNGSGTNPPVLSIIKRNGSNDTSWSFSNTVTLTQTTYVYLFVAQAGISGYTYSK